MDVSKLINEINKTNEIDLIYIINKFEKKLKKCFKLYKNKEGFEDYKMNNIDYIILYFIWKANNEKKYINRYLIIMYSYYKLEDFHYPLSMFKETFNTIEIIKNTDIIYIINNFLNWWIKKNIFKD